MMNFVSLSYAQDATAAASAPSPFSMFLPLIIIFVIFYFLIFRPQQKQQKLKKQMLSDLKRGDEVITNGGIYGKIVEIQEKFVMLQVTNNVTMKLDRSQVNTVILPPELKTK